MLAWASARVSAQTQPQSAARPSAGGGRGVVSPVAELVLKEMALRAGTIFVGRVTAVRRLDGAGGATGVVEIDFAVEDAVRGVRGGTYTLREWAGLWRDSDPLSVGRRYLMLLHAAGAAGLSSPVGGPDGAIPVGAGTSASIDLRWVAARAERPVAYTAGPQARSGVGVRTRVAGETRVDPAAPQQTSAAAPDTADYAAVMELLRTWSAAGDARR